LTCAVLVAVTAAAGTAQQTAKFRAAVDLVRFDVTVLDRNRQPVRGLTAADFIVLEDGREQPVLLATEVEVAAATGNAAPWTREAARDVATNTLDSRRLVLIVVDDAANYGLPGVLADTKAAAHKVIDRLGPNDLAAIVFTADNRRPEDFTLDRTRLRAAVDRAGLGWGNTGNPLFDLYSANVVAAAAELLAALPDLRRVIVYVSSGVPYEPASPFPNQHQFMLGAIVQRLLRDAQRANVSIYSVSPGAEEVHADDPFNRRWEYLRLLSHSTGAFALIQGDLDVGISRIFQETSGYYVLGYRRPNPSIAGSRRVEVKTRRSELTVISRNGYEAPGADRASRDATEPSPLVAALGGVLPRPELPLRVNIAAFPDAGPQAPERTALAVVVAARQMVPPARMSKEVQLQVSVFDPEGRAKGWAKQTVRVTLRPASAVDTEFEVIARVPVVKPGQYNVRVAAHDVAESRTGSVGMMVDVPDFYRAPLSLSGVLISVDPRLAFAPRNALDGLAPVVPTTVRSFLRSDRVEAFARVYQPRAKGGPFPVSVDVKVLDSRDRQVMRASETVAAERFSKGTGSDLRLVVPVQRFESGEYLMTIEASTSEQKVRRDVRFVVR
jgi:VWFA-related protein